MVVQSQTSSDDEYTDIRMTYGCYSLVVVDADRQSDTDRETDTMRKLVSYFFLPNFVGSNW
jgi:hypothetical protein